MEIINRFTYNPQAECAAEVPQGDSETIPDQSYSIQEIITRFTGGIAPNVNRNIYYDEDPDFDSVDPTKAPDFDLVDAYERLQQLSADFEAAKKAATQPEQSNQTAPEIEPDNNTAQNTDNPTAI